MTASSSDINQKFFDSLLYGNRTICSQLIKEQVKQDIDIKDLYENVMKPSLYKIGELWELNKISVATEHLASAIVEAILNELYPELITAPKKEKKAIVLCVENEQHQIGIKMVSDIFEANGWHSYFLGANTPIKELIKFAKITNPDLIAISMSLFFHLPVLENMIQKISDAIPSIQILVGGQGFKRGGTDAIKKYSNTQYLPNLFEFDQHLKKLSHE
ncbi:cobalamin B12-binding domain-containing protein [Marinifilum sp.]|uniref:cobalamin B12-binding domain-containing protein n=1 Tax=Marinifilum sp. TaxID=2033137 RepID=UPI003BAA8C99